MCGEYCIAASHMQPVSMEGWKVYAAGPEVLMPRVAYRHPCPRSDQILQPDVPHSLRLQGILIGKQLRAYKLLVSHGLCVFCRFRQALAPVGAACVP